MAEKEKLVMYAINKFFEQQENMDKISLVLLKKSRVSLRMLDWLVTNYSKKHRSTITLNDKPFVIHLNYKSQLKSFSKKQFDPFCRGQRISYNGLETTIGQLSFFKWAIEKRVLDFAEDYKASIENDMNCSFKTTQLKTPNKKRAPLSCNETKKCLRSVEKIIVEFD